MLNWPVLTGSALKGDDLEALKEAGRSQRSLLEVQTFYCFFVKANSRSDKGTL